MDNKITVEPLSSMTTSMWEFRTLVAGIKLNIFEFNAKKINSK